MILRSISRALGGFALGLAMLAVAGTSHALVRTSPRIYLSWRAPYGSPGARAYAMTSCSDTNQVDTLFISFVTGAQGLPLAGVSGTIVFEPMPPDSLGTYWHFERTGDNPGSLLVDFDLLTGENFDTPWKVLVYGHVGYSHAANRGRLDLSADVPLEQVKSLASNSHYCVARIRFTHTRPGLTGCDRPFVLNCVAALIHLRNGELIHSGPSTSVTWNSKRALPRRHVHGLVETWVPVMAPPSQVSLAPYMGASDSTSRH